MLAACREMLPYVPQRFDYLSMTATPEESREHDPRHLAIRRCVNALAVRVPFFANQDTIYLGKSSGLMRALDLATSRTIRLRMNSIRSVAVDLHLFIYHLRWKLFVMPPKKAVLGALEELVIVYPTRVEMPTTYERLLSRYGVLKRLEKVSVKTMTMEEGEAHFCLENLMAWRRERREVTANSGRSRSA